MDLALPPMPFSTVFVPEASRTHLQIPEEMRTDHIAGGQNQHVQLPAGVVQVIVTWRGTDTLHIRHYHSGGYEVIASIPGVSSATDRSSGVLTLASDTSHSVSIVHAAGGNWNPATLTEGYVAGVQVMPMGTAADITGGGSLLRVDNSVGTRVFLGDQMIHGDTGRRLVNDWGVNGVTTSVELRRVGSLVSMQLTATFPAGTPTGTTIMTIPVGFKVYGHSAMPFGYTQAYPAIAITSGTVKFWGNVPSSTVTQYWRWVYDTKDPWPTSLPGTAA